MALDKVHPTLMTSMEAASETPPSNPNVGQRWFRLSTGVTYQYTNDGTSSFWLDVSSGGIGTSNYRAVNFVGDTDPHPRSNIAGADVGAIYYNREGNRYFELMDVVPVSFMPQEEQYQQEVILLKLVVVVEMDYNQVKVIIKHKWVVLQQLLVQQYMVGGREHLGLLDGVHM